MNFSPLSQLKKELSQARTQVVALTTTLSGLESFIDKLETAVGPLLDLGMSEVANGGLAKRSGATGAAPRTQKVPPTLKEKVLAVLAEQSEPVKPTVIIGAILAKGWMGTPKDPAQLKSSIRATLSFLKSGKKVNYDEERGYSRKEDE